MLPPEHLTEEAEALRAKLAGAPEDALANYPHPTPQDLFLIGAYIQSYAFVDMNLRRCIEVFANADMLAPALKKRVPKLPDGQLVSTVRPIVAAMDPTLENVEDSLQRLDELQELRAYRNLFAHWAVRRVPDADALVFLTKSERDARQTTGQGLALGELATCHIYASDLQTLHEKLRPQDIWIARKLTDWYERYLED